MRNLQKLEIFTVVLLMLGLFSFTAFAGEEKQTVQEMEKFTPNLHKCNSLIGVSLQNNKGENLGTVKEFILDCPINNCCPVGENPKGEKEKKAGMAEEASRTKGLCMPVCLNENRIAYIVISPDKSIETAHDRLPIPWNALKVMPMNEERGVKLHFVLFKDSVALSDAPGFGKEQWPETFGKDWKEKVNRFYGVAEKKFLMKMSMAQGGKTCEGGETGLIRPQRLTKLLGKDVKVENGDQLGKLKDLFIDTRDGVIAYATIEFGGLLGMGEDVAAIPWTALRLHEDKDIFIASVTKAVFEQCAMGEKNFSMLDNMTDARSLFDHFKCQPYWVTYSYLTAGEIEKMKMVAPEKAEIKKGGV